MVCHKCGRWESFSDDDDQHRWNREEDCINCGYRLWGLYADEREYSVEDTDSNDSEPRESDPPDVLNVYWQPGRDLNCLTCSGQIIPEYGSFRYYWCTNERLYTRYDECSESEVASDRVYKFCSERCCKDYTGGR